MAQEYKILIQNEIVSSDSKVPGSNNDNKSDKKIKDATKEKEQSPSELIAAYLGKQALSFAVGTYGTITGNKIQGAALQGAVGIAGDVAIIAKFGKVGAAMVAINAVSKIATYSVNKSIQDRSSEMLTIRTGGSR